MIVFVILLRVLARMCVIVKKNQITVRSFIILRSGEGLISFNKNNRAKFSSEQKYNEAFWGVYVLGNRRKKIKSNLVLVDVLKV